MEAFKSLDQGALVPPGSSDTQVTLQPYNFVQAVMVCFRKYAKFSGRARRSEFWYFYLFYALLVLPLLALANIYEDSATMPSGAAIMMVLSCLSLASFIPLLAALVRRLHDTDTSGAYYFVSLIPFIGGIILIIKLAAAGDQIRNRFGDPE